MEKCLDLALRTEGAAGSDAPTIDNYPASKKLFNLIPLRGLEGHPPETQTNAMFVDRRAGASEYSLLKWNFGTCTRIATREWQ